MNKIETINIPSEPNDFKKWRDASTEIIEALVRSGHNDDAAQFALEAGYGDALEQAGLDGAAEPNYWQWFRSLDSESKSALRDQTLLEIEPIYNSGFELAKQHLADPDVSWQKPVFFPLRPKIGPVLIRNVLLEHFNSYDYTEQERLEIESCYYYGCGGYDIAKQLDDHHGWTIDRDMVEQLDYIDMFVRRRQIEAELAWAQENNIQPPLQIGQRVTFEGNFGPLTGTIIGLSEHSAFPASYRVSADGDENRYYILNYEKVRAAA